MTESKDWIDLLERRERAAEARDALLAQQAVAPEEVHLGRAITRARKISGLSLEELAEKIGTTSTTLRQLERSESSGHSLNLLKRVAEALSMQLNVGFQTYS